MRKIEKKDNLGITLIALVITIIVILILAGISIATMSGNNGLIDQAGNAKNITGQAELEEDVNLAYLSYEGQKKKTNDLEYYLKKINDVNVEKKTQDYGGQIKNCSNSGDIETEKTSAGGIVSDLPITGEASIVYNCNNSGSIKGLNNIGGIVGVKQPSTPISNISGCINTGKLISSGQNVGDIIGNSQQ